MTYSYNSKERIYMKEITLLILLITSFPIIYSVYIYLILFIIHYLCLFIFLLYFQATRNLCVVSFILYFAHFFSLYTKNIANIVVCIHLSMSLNKKKQFSILMFYFTSRSSLFVDTFIFLFNLHLLKVLTSKQMKGILFFRQRKKQTICKIKSNDK